MQKYQGTPISSEFNQWDYKTVFTLNTGVKAPSVLYLNNQYGYPDGYDLRVSNTAGLIAEVKEEGNYISIYFKEGAESETTIEVSRK